MLRTYSILNAENLNLKTKRFEISEFDHRSPQSTLYIRADHYYTRFRSGSVFQIISIFIFQISVILDFWKMLYDFTLYVLVIYNKIYKLQLLWKFLLCKV